MDVRETLALDKPEELRKWLQDNHRTKMEIRLVFYKKSSGRRTLMIAKGVDEALCFGWIQGRTKTLNAQRFAARFSPRRKGSIWSLPNLKQVRKLIAQRKMTEFGLAVLPADFKE